MLIGGPLPPELPPTPSAFEELAMAAELDASQLRDVLRRLIAERMSSTAPSTERAVVACGCGGEVEPSGRRLRAMRAGGTTPLCPTCRAARSTEPDAASRAWAA